MRQINEDRLSAADQKELKQLKISVKSDTAELKNNFTNNPKVKLSPKGRIYKKFRDLLKKTHHGRCAYCDSYIENHPPEVEHYRPKGSVKGGDGKVPKFSYPGAGIISHPGYFWLAYEWENLLLSCHDCNCRRAHDGSDVVGKQAYFPINGTRAFIPSDIIADEDPLIVNPINDKVEDHIKYNYSDGLLVGLTDKARWTIELLGLNVRENLIRGRKEAFDDARMICHCYYAAVSGDINFDTETIKTKIKDILLADTKYSFAARLALLERRNYYNKRGIDFRLEEIIR